MDVREIRVDMAEALNGPYKAHSHVREDVPEYPAAIVGSPRGTTYGETLGLASLDIPVTIAVETQGGYDAADAQLDAAMSTEGDASVPALLNAAKSKAWREIRVTDCEPARIVTIGNATVLAVDFIAAVRARK